MACHLPVVIESVKEVRVLEVETMGGVVARDGELWTLVTDWVLLSKGETVWVVKLWVGLVPGVEVATGEDAKEGWTDVVLSGRVCVEVDSGEVDRVLVG